MKPFRRALPFAGAIVALAASAFAQTPWTVLPATNVYYVDAVRSDSLLVAVGTAMTQTSPSNPILQPSAGISTSTDGLNWTERITGQKRGLNAVTWTGGRFVAVGSYGTVLTSEDGANWTKRESTDSACHLTEVAWNGARLVVTGEFVRRDSLDVVNCVMTSTDGLTWTPGSIPEKLLLRDIVWTGSRFVGVGYTGKGEAHGIVMTSTDGLAWTRQSPGPVSPLMRVIWTGTSLEAVGYGRDSSVVITSPDGVTWTSRNTQAGPSATSIAWSGRRLVVPIARTSALGGSVLVSDSTGSTWSEIATGSAVHAVQQILWVDSMYIAFGSRGLIAVAREDSSTPSTSAPLVAPALLAPADGAAGLDTTLTLRWRSLPGASWYGVQWSADSTFATAVTESLGDTMRVVTLAPATRYFWRVLAGNAHGAGPWSAARRFTTTLPAPAAPVLLAPPQFAAGQATSTLLVWAATPGALDYQAQLSRTANFASPRWTRATSDTTLLADSLAHGASYYWRVRARNAVDWGPWASIRQFTTEPAGPSSLAAGTAARPQLARGELRFSLEQAATVRVTRLDFSGRSRVLFEAPLAAGPHALRLPSLEEAAARGLVLFEAAGRRVLLAPR